MIGAFVILDTSPGFGPTVPSALVTVFVPSFTVGNVFFTLVNVFGELLFIEVTTSSFGTGVTGAAGAPLFTILPVTGSFTVFGG